MLGTLLSLFVFTLSTVPSLIPNIETHVEIISDFVGNEFILIKVNNFVEYA